jgi:hypothetical protein
MAMAKRGEGAAFAIEQGMGGFRQQRWPDALDGDGMIEQAVIARADKDIAHAALADTVDDPVAADVLRHWTGVGLQTASGHGALRNSVSAQQHPDFR